MARFKISIVLLQGILILLKVNGSIDLNWLLVLSPIMAILVFIIGFKFFNKNKWNA